MVEYTIGTANLDATSLTNLTNAIHTSDASLNLSTIITELPYTHAWGASELGTSGVDTMTGTSGMDHFDALAGNDVINGNAGDDFLKGNTGNDTINGGADADHIMGQDNDDTMTGGLEDDLVEGGNGNDIYTYAIGDGSDTYVDSAGTDKIQLGSGISLGNLTLERSGGNDMYITVTNGATIGHITVANDNEYRRAPLYLCA